MQVADTPVAVFADHNAAELAVKKIAQAGFEMKNLSVVGQGSIRKRKSSVSTTPAIGSSFGAPVAHSGEASGVCSLAGCS
jgi:hypothetical protein